MSDTTQQNSTSSDSQRFANVKRVPGDLHIPEGERPRAYRAVFFDLDGTVLPMDLDVFMKSYFKAIAGFMARKGIDAAQFNAALMAGTKAMTAHGAEITNQDAFFAEFYQHVDKDAADWEALFYEFYENEFGLIGKDVTPDLAMGRAINTLVEKGYTLALTTMPMFPLIAVQWRLKWAGVDPAVFQRITTFENSTSVKPRLVYYAENLAAAGVNGSDVLMVGNNTVEDLAALDMGTDAFLVTNELLDPADYDLATVKHGDTQAFAEWVDTLPPCQNPAEQVNAGRIPQEQTEDAYQANVILRRTDEEAEKIAARAYNMGNLGAAAQKGE